MPLNETLPIDKYSLAAFMKQSAVIRRIDSVISKATKLRVVPSDTFVETYVTRLAYVGIPTIEETQHLLESKEFFLTKFTTAWYEGPALNDHHSSPKASEFHFFAGRWHWNVAVSGLWKNF